MSDNEPTQEQLEAHDEFMEKVFGSFDEETRNLVMKHTEGVRRTNIEHYNVFVTFISMAAAGLKSLPLGDQVFMQTVNLILAGGIPDGVVKSELDNEIH